MKLLPLANADQLAEVDDDVFEWASKREWRLHSKGYVISGRHYLHRIILSLAGRSNQGDHRDGNKLDNRRENLRLATHSQNLWNAGKKSHNKSGYKGVYLCRSTGRYRAEIRANNRAIKLGRFNSPEEAARAYDAAARQHHGSFAYLNFGKCE
jgi:ribosomal protein S14